MQRKSKQLSCTWEKMLVWANDVTEGQRKGRKWILTKEYYFIILAQNRGFVSMSTQTYLFLFCLFISVHSKSSRCG